MNYSSAAGSMLANRAIGTKVGLGFACVLVLLAVVSGTAYLSFQSSSHGFESYVQRVSIVGIARDLDRGFLQHSPPCAAGTWTSASKAASIL